MSLPLCTCNHPRADHGEKMAVRGKPCTVPMGCLDMVAGKLCECAEYTEKAIGGAADSATMRGEAERFARWQIKQHQRMIHEIRQRYNLQD